MSLPWPIQLLTWFVCNFLKPSCFGSFSAGAAPPDVYLPTLERTTLPVSYRSDTAQHPYQLHLWNKSDWSIAPFWSNFILPAYPPPYCSLGPRRRRLDRIHSFRQDVVTGSSSWPPPYSDSKIVQFVITLIGSAQRVCSQIIFPFRRQPPSRRSPSPKTRSQSDDAQKFVPFTFEYFVLHLFEALNPAVMTRNSPKDHFHYFFRTTFCYGPIC